MRKSIYLMMMGLILLIISHASFSQNIKFSLFGVNQCVNTTEKIVFYSIKGQDLYVPKDTSGICMLPDTGVYTLRFNGEIRTYHFKDYQPINNTVALPKIEACMSPTTAFSFIGYCCCEQKCNGKVIDYYLNGNKRTIGRFNNGIPIGDVKFYYSNGQIKEISKYRRKGRLVSKKTFDENGNLLTNDKN